MREFCAVPRPSSGVYKGTVCFTVGREPVRRDASSRLTLTVVRGPVPRRASVLTANVHGLWAADVSRFGGEIAGDRPPRYGNRGVSARGLRMSLVSAERSRGTGPRATKKVAFPLGT